MASTLPHEIILEILVRLPAKSLARFRCVNKLWCHSIRDPNFVKSHLHQAIKGNRLNLFLASDTTRNQTHLYCLQGNSFNQSVEIENPIRLDTGNSFDDDDDSDEFDFSDPRVFGTCNGLVCFGIGKDICLLNPCTREYKIVRLDDLSIDDGASYGLGYDEINDDYKLVQFVNDISGSEITFYSLNGTSCSTIFSGISYLIFSEDEEEDGGEVSGIYLNGCLHWVASIDHESPFSIISINVSEEVVREIPLLSCMLEDPDITLDEHPDITLGVLQGELCVFCEYSSQTEIWAMKNYGATDSWVKVFSMEKTVRTGLPPLKPLGFSGNHNVVFDAGLELVIYDPRQKTVEEIVYPGMQWGQICTIITHVASLIPLKSSTYLGMICGDKSSEKQKGIAQW